MSNKKRLFEIFEHVSGIEKIQTSPEESSQTKWPVDTISSFLEEIGQDHINFTDDTKGISQGDYGRVRFEVSYNSLYLTFPTAELAHVAFNAFSESLTNPYEFASRFDEMPNTVMVQFTDSGIDESLLYAHVDSAAPEPSRDKYQIGMETVE